MTKLKILILLSRIDQTGLSTHTLDLTRGLVQAGNKVYLIIGGPLQENEGLKQLHKQFIESGAKIIEFNIPKGNIIVKNIQSIFSVAYILFQILKINPNVIHAQSPYMSFLPWLLRKKFFSTLHVNDLVKTFKYKNATHLIAISTETKDYAIDLYGYEESNISIVHHGVSKDFFDKMSNDDRKWFKRQNDIPTNKIIIGMVASVEKRKGHDVLLKSIQLLSDDLKRRIHIVLLGSSKDGKTNEWLDNMIKETETEYLVTRFEYQNPKKFYDIMDIFVLPSRLEGFPIVVLEAMMSGCCVVRSNNEGANDSINNGTDGFIFKNEGVIELSELLNILINDEEYRKKVASCGQQKAMELFSIEAMTNKTINVYKKHLV